MPLDPGAGRERDVRDAIRGLLLATGQFDDATVTGRLPEDFGAGASDLALAAILPASTRRLQGWDSAAAGDVEYACEVRVVLHARTADPQLCDERAEQLLNALIGAVDGQARRGLALVPGLTIPQMTCVSGWTWLDSPGPPERRIRAAVSTHYLVPWGGFSASP